MGLFICATDGRILDANPAIQKILGFQQDRLRGQHWSKLLDLDDEQMNGGNAVGPNFFDGPNDPPYVWW